MRLAVGVLSFIVLKVPVRVYRTLIRDAQTLAEHGSGWMGLMLGTRLVMIIQGLEPFGASRHEIPAILGALLPAMFWAVSLIIVGVYQLISVVFLCPVYRKNGSMVALMLWLFMSILFFYEPEIPLIGAVFPVMAFMSAMSYLSLNTRGDIESCQP